MDYFKEPIKIPWDEIRSCKYDQTKEQGSSPFEICLDADDHKEESDEIFESPSQKKK